MQIQRKETEGSITPLAEHISRERSGDYVEVRDKCSWSPRRIMVKFMVSFYGVPRRVKFIETESR